MARKKKLSDLLGRNVGVPGRASPPPPSVRNMNAGAKAGQPPRRPSARAGGRRGASR